MSKLSLSLAFLLVLLVSTMAIRPSSAPINLDDDPYIQDLLETLGKSRRSDITPRPVDGASVEIGRAIVEEGRMSNGRRQSRHFVCTSCHNTVQETPDLQYGDPAAMLSYAIEKDLPFLPGTTLFGAVDRETYYNGDYEKKYGDLVSGARRDLRGSIQLCATECAQGKSLNTKDMESVVLYMRSIGLRLSDLDWDDFRLSQVASVLENPTPDNQRELIADLRSSYSLASPATFLYPPEDRNAGYIASSPADSETSESLYIKACLHCHGDQRYSFFELDDDADSKEFLSHHFARGTRYSTYQVVRYGTQPIPGKKAYMPHYTAERMSDGQIEGLRQFLAEGSSR